MVSGLERFRVAAEELGGLASIRGSRCSPVALI